MSVPNHEAAIDAVLVYWLNGTDDEAMKEWWTTQEASETAAELVQVVLEAALETPQ